MPVTITGPRGSKALAAPLRALITAALAPEGLRIGEIAIVLTDDAALRELNRRWRGIDRATDVLSFSYDETGPQETIRPATRRARSVEGDLVISLDRMRDQAKRFGVTDGAELARLVVHGALHLAGLDHQRAAERKAMRLREDAVLRRGAKAVRELNRRLLVR